MVKYSNIATIAASQTAGPLGANHGVGDILERIIIVPATTAPGNVILVDGSGGTAVSTTVYTGGTVGADLTPMVLEIGAVSVVGGWHITTGANVSVVAVGKFS